MNFKKLLLPVTVFVTLLAACKKDNSESNNGNNNDHLCAGGPYSYKADSFVIIIPTAFTPNGDGKNDMLRPVINGPDSSISGFHFSVTDRTGATIYETTDLHDSGWDGYGYIDGKRANDYNYSANLTYTYAGKTTDTCSYIFCLRMDANNCPIAVTKDVSKYRFEDQYDMSIGESVFPTNEIFCSQQ